MFVSTSPIELDSAVGQRYELRNEGPETLYYGQEYVSATKKQGEVAKGQTTTLEFPYYVVSGERGANFSLTFPPPPITSAPVFYVSSFTGSDSKTGRSQVEPLATLVRAQRSIEEQSGGTGAIWFVGNQTLLEPFKRPNGCEVHGYGKAFSKIIQANGVNGNVCQDSSWGSLAVNDSGGYYDLTINGSKAGQTLTPPQTFLTVSATVSSTPTTIHVVDASGFNAAGLTSGRIWLGANLCEFTGLTNTGKAFNPAEPTTSGWEITGVKTLSGISLTCFPEMIVLPQGGFGHGIALQSSRTIVENVLVEGCTGSALCAQGTLGLIAYENKINNLRGQQCNRYGSMEILPSATDGMAHQLVGGNGAMGDLLLAAANWQIHDYHPTGVASPNYNARNAPYAVVIAAPMQRINGFHPDTFPYGQVQINEAWFQQAILRDITIDGELYQPSWAASGAGTCFDFYGQQEQVAAQAFNFKTRMAVRGRVLRPMNFVPVTETGLAAGATYSTPASGAEGTKLQVLNAMVFSPLMSAIAGTCEIRSNAGVLLDTINYTGREFATCWVAKSTAAKSTTLELDQVTGLAASGTVAVYPQGTTEAAVESLFITYTKITGNVLEGIPAEGNGSIPETLPVGAGVTQHYLAGVKSTGAGGVSIPTGSTVIQTGGTTGRQFSTVTGEAQIDTSSNRRQQLTYPASGAGWKIYITGRILNKPNPFRGTVTIGVGETVGKVAHNLAQAPPAGQIWASPTTFAQQEYKVEANATEVIVTLKAAAATTAVTFNVEASVGLA